MDRTIFMAITASMLTVLIVILSLYIMSLRRNRMLAGQLADTIEDTGRKNRFFLDMAHELKTPLSVILGALQLIGMKVKNTADREYISANLKTAECNCYRMLRLINNLLDLARSEAGYMELNPVNCDLGSLLEELVASVRPYAEKKGLELNCIKPDIRIIIALDIEKTERILLNLLSNAIKFTKPGGSIIVSCRRSGDRVLITVKDTGIGIPEEMKDEIFNRFRQSGNCKTAECKGSGIGLSLVKSFVELHQGNIKTVSEKDKGSEFIIDLPAKTVETYSDAACHHDFMLMADEAVKIEFSDNQTLST